MVTLESLEKKLIPEHRWSVSLSLTDKRLSQYKLQANKQIEMF